MQAFDDTKRTPHLPFHIAAPCEAGPHQGLRNALHPIRTQAGISSSSRSSPVLAPELSPSCIDSMADPKGSAGGGKSSSTSRGSTPTEQSRCSGLYNMADPTGLPREDVGVSRRGGREDEDEEEEEDEPLHMGRRSCPVAEWDTSSEEEGSGGCQEGEEGGRGCAELSAPADHRSRSRPHAQGSTLRPNRQLYSMPAAAPAHASPMPWPPAPALTISLEPSSSHQAVAGCPGAEPGSSTAMADASFGQASSPRARNSNLPAACTAAAQHHSRGTHRSRRGPAPPDADGASPGCDNDFLLSTGKSRGGRGSQHQLLMSTCPQLLHDLSALSKDSPRTATLLHHSLLHHLPSSGTSLLSNNPPAEAWARSETQWGPSSHVTTPNNPGSPLGRATMSRARTHDTCGLYSEQQQHGARASAGHSCKEAELDGEGQDVVLQGLGPFDASRLRRVGGSSSTPHDIPASPAQLPEGHLRAPGQGTGGRGTAAAAGATLHRSSSSSSSVLQVSIRWTQHPVTGE